MSATHRSGRSSSRATDMPGYLAMPTGVALTTPSAARTARAGSSTASAQPGPNRPHRSGASPIGVDDGKPADLERQQGMGDRGPGAAGAELHDIIARHVGKPALEA